MIMEIVFNGVAGPLEINIRLPGLIMSHRDSKEIFRHILRLFVVMKPPLSDFYDELPFCVKNYKKSAF